MQVILIDEQHAIHLQRVYNVLHKPRNLIRRLEPAYTKDGCYVINACVLNQTAESQRFNHYINIIDWIKGNLIEISEDEIDGHNLAILQNQEYTLEELNSQTQEEDYLLKEKTLIDQTIYSTDNAKIGSITY